MISLLIFAAAGWLLPAGGCNPHIPVTPSSWTASQPPNEEQMFFCSTAEPTTYCPDVPPHSTEWLQMSCLLPGDACLTHPMNTSCVNMDRLEAMIQIDADIFPSSRQLGTFNVYLGGWLASFPLNEPFNWTHFSWVLPERAGLIPNLSYLRLVINTPSVPIGMPSRASIVGLMLASDDSEVIPVY